MREDDKLTLKREEFLGNQMRTDGYYYTNFGNPERIEIYFFYRNGVLLYGASEAVSELEGLESKYRDGTYYNMAINHNYYWGIFVVEDSSLKFERWYPSQKPHYTFINFCEIINDTTFHISKIMRSNGSEESNLDYTFHFKKFSPKPDSTNQFVE